MITMAPREMGGDCTLTNMLSGHHSRSVVTPSNLIHTHLRLSNRPPDPLSLLPSIQPSTALNNSRILALLHSLLALRQDHLDVAWIAHVRIDTTVRSVRASSLLRCLVDLNVLDDEVGGVETLAVSVGFGVLEEAEEEFGGLDGVAGFRDAELLACEGEVLVEIADIRYLDTDFLA